MTLHAKASGVWSTVNDLYIRQSGLWVPVQNGYVRNAGAWVEFFSSEVVVTIAANSTNVNLSALFTNAVWISTTKKRVVVQSGVTIGSTSPTNPAMQTGTGWGGTLTLDNAGTIQGAGGVLNSGIGGGALLANAAGLVVNNTGTIRSGGGGGGKGGNGGAGSASVTQGPYSTSTPYDTYAWWSSVANTYINWGGTYPSGTPGYTGSPSTTSYSSGGWTYNRGAFTGSYDLSEGDGPQFFVSMYQLTRTQAGATVGGAGGNGGRGTGHDGAGAAGAAGAAGGTNAGAGGAGGAGGAYGATGTTGSTGAAGNAGAGTAGTAGGVAGISYNAANITMNNTGTIQGRTV